MFTLEDWIVDIAFLLIVVGGITGLVAATIPAYITTWAELDWFYNTLDQHHYYLMPLVDFLEDRVALINIEHNQCIAIDKSAEGAINGSFSEDEANYLIKIPVDQVEVTYRFK